jgi:hypothetical protein
MANSLGVAGWGVGGIEAVVAMLGQVNTVKSRLTRKRLAENDGVESSIKEWCDHP